MKACIACAEEIKAEAKLCKYCGTRQDDQAYLNDVDEEAPPMLDFENAIFNQSVHDWALHYSIKRFLASDESEIAPKEVQKLGPTRVWTILVSYDESGAFAMSDLLMSGDYSDALIVGWLIAGNESGSRDLIIQLVERELCEACEGDGCKQCREIGWRETPLIGGLDEIIEGF